MADRGLLREASQEYGNIPRRLLADFSFVS